MSNESPLDRVARETGMTFDQVRAVTVAALRELHKIAVTSEFGSEAVVQECYYSFGHEACYHLGGILETDRVIMSHDDPWTEFFIRFAPELLEEFGPFGSRWLDERSTRRRELDHFLQESGRW